ncbi:hypothetical protein [Rhodoferax sp.]|uniref:hypothetical protein n=1 Tax=Rhodoferax sp. TaxID=50421 RepID=UPI0025DE0B07|nr:hypothetical protein [Rhodoferax sp.]
MINPPVRVCVDVHPMMPDFDIFRKSAKSHGTLPDDMAQQNPKDVCNHVVSLIHRVSIQHIEFNKAAVIDFSTSCSILR